MKYYQTILKVSASIILLASINMYAQNPIITNQFTADPSARVFDGKVYLYPSHDIPPVEGKTRPDWFCMEDYHVFSSSNLTEWTDYGVILDQTQIPWANPTAYSLWAPDCIYRNGKYYFYFPAPHKDTTKGRGFSIGVATSDNPYGPFTPEPEPIKGVRGIDPNVLIDKDGQAYLYWSARNIFVAKLKENMTELESEPLIIPNLPDKGLKEGPFVFERNGIYYLTFPHVENVTERLEYAIADNPMGPFEMVGVIMDESPTGCWTNHHSIIEYDNQWYLFYHHNDYSPNFDKNRSVRIDSLFFNEDGTIQKVIPTLRGVGITNASDKIQIDRFSLKSSNGSSIDFLDTLKRFEGWKTILDSEKAWMQYNSVHFEGSKKHIAIKIRASSKTGADLLVRLNNAEGPIIAEVKIPKVDEWTTVTSPLLKYEEGINNIIIQLKNNYAEIDWISFE